MLGIGRLPSIFLISARMAGAKAVDSCAVFITKLIDPLANC